MGLGKKLLRLLGKGRSKHCPGGEQAGAPPISAAFQTCLGPVASITLPGPCQTLAAQAPEASVAALEAGLTQAPPPQAPDQQLSPQEAAWLAALVDASNTPENAVAAAEQLFRLVSGSRELSARLGSQAALLQRLRELLLGQVRPAGSDEGRAPEQLQVHAAYLTSTIAGSSSAADTALVRAGLVGALLSLLSNTRSWDAKKGALRALSKLLGSQEAVQHLVGCGGLEAVAALLDSDDSGIIRRCLAILSHACSSPSLASAAAADIVGCGGLGSLVRLLRCESQEVHAEATEVVKLLCRQPKTGVMLAELDGIQSLARMAGEGRSQAARAAARVALQRLAEAARGQPEGLQVLQALQTAANGWVTGGSASSSLQFSTIRPFSSSSDGSTCLQAVDPTPPHPPMQQHPHSKPAAGSPRSPYSALSPPDTASTAQSAATLQGRPKHSACNTRSSARSSQQQSQQQGDCAAQSVFIFTSESALNLVPAFERVALPPRAGLWASQNPEQLAGQVAACSLGGSRHRPAALLPSSGGSHPLAAGGAGSQSGCSMDSGGTSREARDQFDTDMAPSTLMEDDQGWLIRPEDIAICRDAEGREEKLGEGGFGVVFKAVMCGVDEVAVKRVRAEAPSTRDLALFNTEVQVLRSLRHRCIVQYYGACLEPDSIFFVMELMKGGDLYTALRRHPDTLAWGRLGRKVALDVALGLHHLHSRRPPLLHRDLKSPNVLLAEEGVAKIADCGMVREQLTALVTAQPVLTPLWAAPEVLRRERASIKADIWSFGILIWEVVTRGDITQYQPFGLTRMLQQGPGSCRESDCSSAPVLALPPDCPPVAAHIFEQCTQLDPTARPSAAQIVGWLREIL